MITILIFSLVLFLILTIINFFLSVSGIRYKTKEYINPKEYEPERYPTVDVLVPAYNEEVVVVDTLTALSKLKYKGKLKVYLLDDNSSDKTGEIAERFCRAFKNINYVKVPVGDKKGKSRVLNYGLSISRGEYFVVYDGDNQPQSDAVQFLVDRMLKEKTVGAVGTVRTINANKNLLTRMIAIEFQVFQLILQAGRWNFSKVGSLPGTNMLLSRKELEEVGGYDENALTEDAELTMRLLSYGKKIAVEPRAVTWEQEPESLKALIRQRTRWMQGNIYLTIKGIFEPSWWNPRCIEQWLHYLVVYIIFPIILVPCNIIFILGIFGFVNIYMDIPFLIFWFMLYYIYTMQILIAKIYDDTLTFKNLAITTIMYFTYAQLFIFIFFKSIIMMIRSKKYKGIEWEKTNRVKNVKNIQH